MRIKCNRMRSFFAAAAFTLLTGALPLYAQSNTVILLRQDNASAASLSAGQRNYFDTAYRQFMAGLSKDVEISLQEENTLSAMRSLQKQSQLEVEKGLASDAYEIDRRTLAPLLLVFSLQTSGGYRLSCTVTHVEKQESFSVNASRQLSSVEEIGGDEYVDLLAYELLTALAGRNYIAPPSPAVVSQLRHEENSVDSLRKYVNDYAAQLAAANQELEKLRAQGDSVADRLAAEDAERALRLRMEMIARNKQIAEDNLRRKQAEDAAAQKRELELEKMQSNQRNAFLAKIADLDARRREIQKAERSQLSLKKRIELIEQGKANLAALRTALNESIQESKSQLSLEEAKEIAAKEAEPYGKAELSKGKPTAQAKEARLVEVRAIQTRYASLRNAQEEKMRSAAQPELQRYEQQLAANIAELQESSYDFRSIDGGEDYLSLTVAEYDGELSAWEVFSSFNLDGIPKLLLENTMLPATVITYKMMTGLQPPSPADTDAWKAYKSTVETNDLYFRASVPYLYSKISVTIVYDKKNDRYVATPQSFAIYKTEDNAHPLLTYAANDFARDKKREAERLRQLQEEEKARREEEARSQARAARREAAAIRSRERHDAVVRGWRHFVDSQRCRRGLIGDIGYIKAENFSGLDSSVQLLWGGHNFFMGAGMDFLGLELADGYHLDVSSPYAYRTGFHGLDSYGTAGWSLTLGPLAPYVGTSLGGYSFYVNTHNSNTVWNSDSSSTSSSESTDYDPVTASLKGGFFACAFAGLDVRLDYKLVLGAWYKLRYFSDIGFADSYGMSLGFRY